MFSKKWKMAGMIKRIGGKGKTKKYILVVVSVLMLAMALATPALAAAPGEEAWGLGSAGNGAVVVGYDINTTNLQVSQFWIDNNSDWTIYLYILRDGELIFDLLSLPNSGITTKSINNFKFQRIPATDPDDPNSIRYPNKVSIFWGKAS